MKWLIAAAAVLAVGVLATRDLWLPGRGDPVAEAAAAVEGAAPVSSLPPARSGPCAAAPAFAEAARANAESFAALTWKPFGVEEMGWDAYAPYVAREIDTSCGPADSGFAAALAAWERTHDLPADGRVDADALEAMRVSWMVRRPFALKTRDGTCIPGADPATLADAAREEGYWGKAIKVDRAALAAYRRMREAARREVPEAAADPSLLAIISGYRDPAADEARCDREGGCDGPARARCSAHRTGLAFDLYVGAAPGSDPTSTSDVNRSFQAQTPIHRWLVRNADRFGFAPYPYEPWHWEWIGKPQ